MDLSTPKGTKDFTVELEIIRKKIVSEIEDIFQKYGYEPITTPIVEYWDTLKGKYGEEAENKLIWRFKLPFSEREYALKYDNTVPLARYYAKYRPLLPFKRYTIDRVFRYDEPQKGRYREFWQADVDILGSPYPEADAEILKVFNEVFERLGFRDFRILINDRRIMDTIFSGFGIEYRSKVYRIIDKLDKVGLENVKRELLEFLDKDKVERIINLISLEDKEALEYISRFKGVEEYVEDIKTIIDLSGSNKIIYKPSLVRGLDYYTGMVFEVVYNGYPGSLGGGGRYDDLIEVFAGSKVPAVGGSVGINRVMDLGIDLGIFKVDKKTYTEIAVIYIGDTFRKAWNIANDLRKEGFKVYIDLMRSKFKKQIEYAISKDIRYLIIVGEEDLKENMVTFQDRYLKKREKVDLKDLINLLNKKISNRSG
ncbi:MAG: histidine--tRNA ligase [Candidatus Nanoclepta minutus]|uniref:Histidine--tRNA ligase n=1 Tax=Candidatus Nanoclepta minutus TaxID=1940235 RepID=A0A397WPS1_9ARCH|nr:MAG: histidine--tRNA ligase [Candidatus Nanoclepta minutus]